MAGISGAAHAAASSNQSDCINRLYGQDILSVGDLSLEQIHLVLNAAAQLKQKNINHLLADKIIAHCFFEPSTRTRLSFEAATQRLGGKVIGFSGDQALSIRKGETLCDTMRVISAYADLIIIRHPKAGAARLAAEITEKPVINAGDGANQHPTQTLVDLFTMQECQKRLNNLAIALVGDLKYGRTVHSLAQACKLFDMRLFLVAPDELMLPESICNELKKEGIRFSLHHALEEVIPKVDILYVTRIQHERFTADQQVKKQYILTPALLGAAKSNLKVLHPLPRINEIEYSIDTTPFAYYFEQAANGLYVRQALLTLLLNQGWVPSSYPKGAS